MSGILAVMLSAAKHLCVRRARPFAALRVTFADLTAVPEEVVRMLLSKCLEGIHRASQKWGGSDRSKEAIARDCLPFVVIFRETKR